MDGPASRRRAGLNLSRRTMLGGAIGLAGAGALSMSRSPSKPAAAARAFSDSVGICTHPNWRDTLWGTVDWSSAVLRSGVKFIRGKIGTRATGRAALDDLRPLFDNGVRICVTIAENRGADFDLAATREALDFLASEVGAANLCGIESANEYNSPRRKPPDWAPRLRTFQRWLHDTVRANPAFRDVPLIAPSIWGRLTQDYLTLGRIGAFVDRANLHYYTGGRRPDRVGVTNASSGEAGGLGERRLADALRDARLLAPGKPLWVTEFGYPLKGPGAGAHRHVGETTAAKYLLRGLFDMFGEKVEKTFIYTLIDDVHERPPEYHGLLSGAMKPRQGFLALRNLMALFRDDGASAGTNALHYSIAGAPADLREHLFQKSDGTHLLVLYRNADSYDRLTRRDIAVAPQNLRLALGNQVRSAEIFRPTFGGSGRMIAIRDGIVSLPVGDDVTVVRIAH